VSFAAIELHPRMPVLCSAYLSSHAPKIVNFVVQESEMKQIFYCVDIKKKQLQFTVVSLGVDWIKNRVDFRCKLLDFFKRSIDLDLTAVLRLC
jgi:hypothetical protein